MTDTPVCIDISHWQGYPDFNEVARAGVLGVIHKATEGTTYVDPNCARNCANALNAGLAIATYFWLKPGDARSQVEFYLSTIDPLPGERVVIDYEEDGCTLDMLREAVQALLDYALDLKITVYSGHLLKEQLGDDRDDFLAENTDLWLAQYSSESNITWPDGTYPDWALWQYSESGEVDGIDGALVDLNKFDGDGDDFLDWINPAGGVPTPPFPPVPTETVDIAITAPEGVTVTVTVNGVKRSRPHQAMRRGPDIIR
jgi:lysozyme